jgi:hypothetical protein
MDTRSPTSTTPKPGPRMRRWIAPALLGVVLALIIAALLLTGTVDFFFE